MISVEYIAILIVSMVLAWALGRIRRKKTPAQALPEESEYFKGLAFLLEDKTDEALKSFIHAIEVNQDTLETHMALGGLFRKRGETEKALLVHQNLFGRPGIPKKIQNRVQYELALDYLSSGLLGRAESLFEDLAVQSSEYQIQCYSELLGIYEEESDWLKCTEVAKQLGRKLTSKQRIAVSHYYCELALEYIKSLEKGGAQRAIKQALSFHSGNARALMIQADIWIQNKQYRKAIKNCRKIVEIRPEFIAEMLPTLKGVTALDGSYDAYHQYIQSLVSSMPIPSLIHASAESIYHTGNKAEAIKYLAQQLTANPSKKGMKTLFEWTFNQEDQVQVASQAWLHSQNEEIPDYRCTHCGFQLNTTLWQCPQCKSWETLVNVEDSRSLSKLSR